MCTIIVEDNARHMIMKIVARFVISVGPVENDQSLDDRYMTN